jgi:hypothetical protein
VVEQIEQQKAEIAKKARQEGQGQDEPPDLSFAAAAKAMDDIPQPPNMGSHTEEQARATEDAGKESSSTTASPVTAVKPEVPSTPRSTKPSSGR